MWEGRNEKKRPNKKAWKAGFIFERHGSNHDIYKRGNEREEVPRHKEIND